jgi:hypothetical protein
MGRMASHVPLDDQHYTFCTTRGIMNGASNLIGVLHQATELISFR